MNTEERMANAEDKLRMHLAEVQRLVYGGDKDIGKKAIGLMTIITYSDRTCYPHLSGMNDPMRLKGVAGTFLDRECYDQYGKWANSQLGEDGEKMPEPEARRVLEGGF